MGDGVEAYNALKSLQRASGVKQPPVALNIKAFKRYLKAEHPDITKHERNAAVKIYKEKGWQEYADVVNYMGHFPSHTDVKKTTEDKDGQSKE